jgi:hypothetical protein
MSCLSKLTHSHDYVVLETAAVDKESYHILDFYAVELEIIYSISGITYPFHHARYTKQQARTDLRHTLCLINMSSTSAIDNSEK